jgi:hypothetical protein
VAYNLQLHVNTQVGPGQKAVVEKRAVQLVLLLQDTQCVMAHCDVGVALSTNQLGDGVKWAEHSLS